MSYRDSTTNTPVSQQAISPEDYFTKVHNAVRGDKRLDGNAKILLGVIQPLCTKEGYCWASNPHFAKMFNVSVDTITRWLQQLQKCGYIRMVHDQPCKNGTERHIFMAEAPREMRDSTPQTVAEVLSMTAQEARQKKSPIRNPADTPNRTCAATPTRRNAVTPIRNPAEQLDQERLEKRKEDGMKRVAASPPDSLSSFSEGKKEQDTASPPVGRQEFHRGMTWYDVCRAVVSNGGDRSHAVEQLAALHASDLPYQPKWGRLLNKTVQALDSEFERDAKL